MGYPQNSSIVNVDRTGCTQHHATLAAEPWGHDSFLWDILGVSQATALAARHILRFYSAPFVSRKPTLLSVQ